jgi:TP901 family phage tail tape measure protein
MTSNNNLKTLNNPIKLTLDIDQKKSISQLNQAIKAIEKNAALKKLTLNLSVDTALKAKMKETLKEQTFYNSKALAIDKAHYFALQQNAARDLEYHKQIAATKGKLGQLKNNLPVNSEALSSLQALEGKLKQITNIGNFSSPIAGLEQEIASFSNELTVADSKSQALSKALEKVSLWGKQLAWTGAKDVVKTIIEIDAQMTSLGATMGNTANLKAMLDSSQQTASQYGRSIQEINQHMLSFAGLGYNESDTTTLSNTAALFQNIANLSPEQSIRTVTAAMSAFQIEAEKSTSIADKVASVNQSFGTSSTVLSTSLAGAAEAARNYGFSIDDVLGNTAAISTVTHQNGEAIASSLQSIYAGITSLSTASPLLSNVGISMQDVSGNMKSGSAILGELAGKWSSLTQAQQTNLATQIAGKDGLNAFIALMGQYDLSSQATTSSLYAQGTAMQSNEVYMDSLSGRIQGMKTAWDGLTVSLGDGGVNTAIGLITTALTTLTGIISNAVEHFGTLPTMIGIAYASFKLFHGVTGLVTNSLAKVIANAIQVATATKTADIEIKTFSMSSKLAATGITSLSGAMRFLGASIKSVLASTGIGIALVLLGSITEGLIGSFMQAKDAGKELSNAMDNIQNKKDEVSNLIQLSQQYETLASKTQLSADEKIKLTEIERQLSNEHGIAIQATNGQSDAINNNTLAIQNKIKFAKEELAIAREKAELTYSSQANAVDQKIAKTKSKIDENQNTIDTVKNKKAGIESDYLATNNGQVDFKKYYDTDQANILYGYGVKQNYSDLLQGADSALKQAFEKQQELLTEYAEQVKIKTGAIDGAFQNFIDKQEENGVKISASTRPIAEVLSSAFAKTDIQLPELKSHFQEFFNIIQSSDTTNMNEIMAKLQQTSYFTNLSKENMELLQNAIGQIQYTGISNTLSEDSNQAEQTAEKVTTLAEAIQKLDQAKQGDNNGILAFSQFVNDSKDNVSLLNSAQEQLENNQSLSVDTIQKINDKYGDFISVTHLSRKAMLDYINLKRNATKEDIQLEIKKTEVAITEAKKRINQNNIESQFYTPLRNELDDAVKSGSLSQAEAETIYNQYKEQAAQSNAKKALEEDIVKQNLLKAFLDELSQANEKNKVSNDKVNQSYKETVNVLTETQKRLQAITDATKKLQNGREMLNKGSQAYRDNLAKEIKLKKEELALYEKAVKNPSILITRKETATSLQSAPTSTSSFTNDGVGSMLSTISSLQGKFTYKQVGGKYKGTYDQFVKGAVSDCSQLMQEMFQKFLGIHLPRTSSEQFKEGTPVDKKNLQQGDLVFFNTSGKGVSHVGVYSGNGKFLQMGNHGLSEQSLDEKAWAGKYVGARRVTSKNNSASGTKSSSGTIINPIPSSELDEAQRTAENMTSELVSQIFSFGKEMIASWVEEFNVNMSSFDNKKSYHGNKQKRFTEDSPQWRNEEILKRDYTYKQIDNLEKENQKINELLKKNNLTIDEYNLLMQENNVKREALLQEATEQTSNIINSQLTEYSNKMTEIDHQISLSNGQLALLTEGSSAYNTELAKQQPLLQNKQKLQQAEITYLQAQMRATNLTAAQTEQYSQKLNELNVNLLEVTSSLNSVNQKLYEMRENAADNLIDEYKKVLEQQRDLTAAAIDQSREKEEERHKKRLENIEAEQKKEENYINARLKALDRLNASEDFQAELTNKLKDRQEIVDKLNVLSLDNSMDSKAKQKDLRKQLANVDEEIRKYEQDRQRELVKQGLQDQLDSHKEYTDKLTEEENKSYSDSLKGFEDQKKANEQTYKDILNDQKRFYDLKQKLMSDDTTKVQEALTTIQGSYNTLFTSIKGHIFNTSVEMNNMIYAFEKSMEAISKFSTGDYSVTKDFEAPKESIPAIDAEAQKKAEAKADWGEYLSNKKRAEDIRADMSNIKSKQSAEYKKLEAEFLKLAERNTELRGKHSYEDGSYAYLSKLNLFSADTGGMTPAWGSGGKLLLAHEKELILNKFDTANLLKVVDFTRNMIDGLKGFGTTMFASQFSAPSPPQPATSSIQIQSVEINATDKDTGVSLLNKFEQALQLKMKHGTI